jgi:hypothetical protein
VSPTIKKDVSAEKGLEQRRVGCVGEPKSAARQTALLIPDRLDFVIIGTVRLAPVSSFERLPFELLGPNHFSGKPMTIDDVWRRSAAGIIDEADLEIGQSG